MWTLLVIESAFVSTGTAVWVRCILLKGTTQQYYQYFGSTMNFELDGVQAGSFSHSPVALTTAEYLYNQTVFSKTGLSNHEHTLMIKAAPESNRSVILFDWATYT